MTCPQCFYARVNANGDCPRCHGQGLNALNYSRKSKTKRRAPISTPINNSQPNTPQSHTPTPHQSAGGRGLVPRPVAPGRAGGMNAGAANTSGANAAGMSNLPSPPSTPQRQPATPISPPVPQPQPKSPSLPPPNTQQPPSIPFCPCPVCSNLEVQKVSAIVRAGTWGETTSWSQQTQMEAQTNGASFGVMYGDKQSYPMGTVSGSRTNGQASTSGQGSSSGATTLAQFLAAPLRPAQPVRQGITENGLQFFWGVPFFLTLGWLAGIVAWWVAFPLSLLCFGVLFSAWQTNRDEYQKAKANLPAQERLWSERYSRWERLYYCSRCDYVFLPESRRFAPIAQMYALLDNDG